MRPPQHPLDALLAERGRLAVWAPVCLSLGIGLYFGLPREPPPALLAAALLPGLGLLALWRRGPERWRLPALGLMLALSGLGLAAARAHLVAAPVLPFRYYGPVEGRVVMIDRSFSDQIRLTLDRAVLEGLEPEETPGLVRVALHGSQGLVEPAPGMVVILSGHLAPPEGPVAPGGFDFQRLAWFAGLGAVGYTRTPVLALEPADPADWTLAAHRLRMRLSGAMQDRISGQAGAFAAALMTGDRSGIEAATNAAMRASNLSHLISISGLHMGLLTGFVFAALRYGLALVPPLALRLPAKKIAAAVALMAAVFYLWLAGPNVATERSFVMAAVMLVAVLADRRAISLRSVAVAALILLVLQPESLVEPGFQMSFAATVALILCFGPWMRLQPRLPAPLRPLAMLLVSSLAAGTATAPIAAAHFNRVAEYGLLANLLAVPVMGTLVMPAGVIAAVLAPLGLAQPALWVMEIGTRWILFVADWVAGLDGAVFAVPAPPAAVLPLLSLGGLLAAAARGWPRWSGAALCLAAFWLWAAAERPSLLISADGALTGVMTAEGRALSRARGAGFVAQSWLEDDGDLAAQEEAAARAPLAAGRNAAAFALGPHAVRQFFGKGAALAAAAACRDGALVILAARQDPPAGGDCLWLDQKRLAATGALAVEPGPGGPRLRGARAAAGERLWNSRRVRAGG